MTPGGPDDRNAPRVSKGRREGAARAEPDAAPRTEVTAPPSEPEPASAPPSIPSAADVDEPFVNAPPPPDLEPAPATTTRALPGHVIADRYEVVRVLGEGGMGIVYLCHDQASGELVALKRVIIPDGKLANDYVMWFYKESRALAALDHPSIVGARDFGQLADGSPFLVMDLASGTSLHDLTAVRLSFPIIWAIADQVMGALAHAHARGIVHGDLKPSNVLVEELEGQPPAIHILDFGLAWLKEDPHDERLDGAKALEFAPHAGAGTPGYMAPEQIQHEMHHVCGATDLYSLGCILYKLLSGRAPFSGDPKALLRMHAFDDAPPLELAIDAPPEVTTFVHRLLAKRPWERWEFAAGARADWARLRPPMDVDASVWRFPPLRASATAGAPTTRQTGPRGPNPDLAPAQNRAPGLLSMRPSPLVGREDIRRRLRELCDEVIEGEGAPHRLVLLVGPAGVGKSRIVEWLCEAVHEEGTMVPLRSRYRAMRTPLDGMVGAVTQYYNFERTNRDVIERSLMARWNVDKIDKNGRTWVAGASEWLRPTPPGSDHVGPSGIRFTLDTIETQRLVHRYTIRRIAAGRPLLFWLDDLNHAGETTIDGFLRMHTEDPEQRLVMVATVRSEDIQVDAPAAERLRRLREALGGIVIEVAPMDADTTAELLRASLPLDDAAVREAAKRSRGNPLFALQQLHAWALARDMELVNGMYRVPGEVLALRPQTTAELWDSRVAAMPEGHRLAAYATATMSGDLREVVLSALFGALGLPAADALRSLEEAEIVLPRGPGRYNWPHALLQEHLLSRLLERDDHPRIFHAAADALTQHPSAGTRRVVRQRVANLIRSGEPDAAGQLLFAFLEQAWSGSREPLATLSDLELLKGKLTGRSLALKHRWQAEALRHVGRSEEASTRADIARTTFEELGDRQNLAHCLRLLGHLASERGTSAEGLLLVDLAHQIFTELGDTLGMAQCEAVGGEIEYLLGNYESARRFIEAGEKHFAAVGQPLGRGQCLLLLSWIAHSEGVLARARRLALEARAEFERAGYRLGIAQADAGLAHVEHRLMNFYSAEVGIVDALGVFEALRTPRGHAACERLLAMIGLDTDDLDTAELHVERAATIYQQMGDPWGILEAKVLACQVALARHRLELAEELVTECQGIHVEEAEPRQHLLLTRAWYHQAMGEAEKGFEALEAAAEVFGNHSRAGDHAPHLLGRLSRLAWPRHALDRIEAWRAQLADKSLRAE
ncbi:MAG: protein kinase [Sorangiineae bacterium]|nr:protein kinase [Polyangiaceae bacterium]MEB2323627.1 protein kinase [Sorangiineae bacterium]